MQHEVKVLNTKHISRHFCVTCIEISQLNVHVTQRDFSHTARQVFAMYYLKYSFMRHVFMGIPDHILYAVSFDKGANAINERLSE